jgi:hypothetical protein
MQITKFELISHGFDHSQYFQGCGTSFTEFDHVQTGCGGSEKEAFEDALEQLCMNHSGVNTWDIEVEAGKLSQETPKDIPEDNEVYFYYSIRYNLEDI